MNELDRAEMKHEIRKQVRDLGFSLGLKTLENLLVTCELWAEVLVDEKKKGLD